MTETSGYICDIVFDEGMSLMVDVDADDNDESRCACYCWLNYATYY